ncbi:MAG: hypothetical protein AAF633_23615 [Chloroflexota bacterium]
MSRIYQTDGNRVLRGRPFFCGVLIVGLLGILSGCGLLGGGEPTAGTTVESFTYEPEEESVLAPLFETEAGLITYIGADGNLYTVEPSGENQIQLTEDAVVPDLSNQAVPDEIRLYQLPTWSKTEKKIAYYQFDFDGENGEQTHQIWVTDSVGQDTTLVSESPYPSIYYDWSPDSSTLGVLNGSANQRLFQMRIFPLDGEMRTVDVGAPLFFDWSPHSQQSVMHIGAAGNNEKLSLFSLSDDDDLFAEVFDIDEGGFNTPDWSPNGESLLFARRSIDPEDDDTLIVSRDVASREDSVIAKYDGEINVAASYSPDNQNVAFIPSEGVPYGRLFVANLDTKAEVSSTSSEVTAYFWSPDGSKIAYLALYFPPVLDEDGEPTAERQDTADGFGLYVLDVESGTSTKLLEPYFPTDSFGDVLRFYHQYQHAVTIWSPDSENIVVPVELDEGPVIVVMNAAGGASPLVIADGSLAFWSWN